MQYKMTGPHGVCVAFRKFVLSILRYPHYAIDLHTLQAFQSTIELILRVKPVVRPLHSPLQTLHFT